MKHILLIFRRFSQTVGHIFTHFHSGTHFHRVAVTFQKQWRPTALIAADSLSKRHHQLINVYVTALFSSRLIWLRLIVEMIKPTFLGTHVSEAPAVGPRCQIHVDIDRSRSYNLRPLLLSWDQAFCCRSRGWTAWTHSWTPPPLRNCNHRCILRSSRWSRTHRICTHRMIPDEGILC